MTVEVAVVVATLHTLNIQITKSYFQQKLFSTKFIYLHHKIFYQLFIQRWRWLRARNIIQMFEEEAEKFVIFIRLLFMRKDLISHFAASSRELKMLNWKLGSTLTKAKSQVPIFTRAMKHEKMTPDQRSIFVLAFIFWTQGSRVSPSTLNNPENTNT